MCLWLSCFCCGRILKSPCHMFKASTDFMKRFSLCMLRSRTSLQISILRIHQSHIRINSSQIHASHRDWLMIPPLVATDKDPCVCISVLAVGGEAGRHLRGGPAAPLGGGQESQRRSVVRRLPLPPSRQLGPASTVTHTHTHFLTSLGALSSIKDIFASTNMDETKVLL